MKTAEFLVEPLLIGYAVLVTAAMLAMGDPGPWLPTNTSGEIATLAVFAYFVGVVFDRVADTILGPLEQHYRLQFALRHLRQPHHIPTAAADDPFPKDAYQVRVMQNEQAWAHASYLRSRIRLVRALVVLTPALGVASAVYAVANPRDEAIRWMGSAGVVVAYAVVGMRAARRPDRVTVAAADAKASGYDPPRTAGLSDPVIRRWYTDRFGDNLPLYDLVIRAEPAHRIALLLAGIAGLIALVGGSLAFALLIPIATILLLSVLTFCWWRITETFFTFLRNYNLHSVTAAPMGSQVV